MFNNTHINNTELSVIIQQLVRIIVTNNTTTINNYATTTDLAKCAPPCAYRLGTVHAGVTGSGSLSISNLAGVLVAITTDIGSVHDLPGNPPYLWSRGWLSIGDSNGMLAEHRLTREMTVWLPPEVRFAQNFNYLLPAGLVIEVTELVPA